MDDGLVPPDRILFVGCSNGRIASLGFNPSTSSLTVLHSKDAGKDIGWLAFHPNSERVVLAADGGSAVLAAFEIAPSNELRLLKTVDTGGAGPATVEVASNGRYAAVANYGGGSVATLSLLPNGIPWSTSLLVQAFELDQAGPRTDRQSASYPHHALYDPTGAFLFVADLGADLIRVFASPSTGTGAVEALFLVRLEPGTGPRHLAFYQPMGGSASSPASHLYVINELSNSVCVFKLSYPEPNKVQLEQIQSVPTLLQQLPAGQAAFASEAAIHREHGLLFAGNRYRGGNDEQVTYDDVTVFAINDRDRTLSPLRSHSLSAKNVKHFELDPVSREWLAVAAKGSGEVLVFRVQGWSQVARIECEAASCVRWWSQG